MFVTRNNNNFIKFQEYLPTGFPDPNNFTQTHLSQINQELINLRPDSTDIIYFKWDNNNDYLLNYFRISNDFLQNF